jgi:hypothetical protein
MNESSGDRGNRVFIEELRRLGYVEGQNLVLARYSGDGRTEHFGELANDVVRTKPDVIYTIRPWCSPDGGWRSVTSSQRSVLLSRSSEFRSPGRISSSRAFRFGRSEEK